MNAAESWIQDNTYYCNHLRARVSPEQCQRMKRRPRKFKPQTIMFSNSRPDEEWDMLQPFACRQCPGFAMRRVE